MSTDTLNADIAALVQGLDPVDWIQLKLTANLSPGQRILTGIQAQAFAMATLRGAFHRRFPELSQAELNMKVLAYLTPVRIALSGEAQ
jgi:ribonuclease I